MSRLFAFTPAPAPNVLSGIDAVRRLGPVAEGFGWTRALIVTSPSLLRGGVVDAVRDGLGRDRAAAVFSESREHTPIACVEDAYEVARSVQADVIIGVGGGSAMDTAKGVCLALMAGSSDISAYAGTVGGFKARFADPVGHIVEVQRLLAAGANALPLVQVPTTLSAAEATQHAGITGRDLRKEQYHHPLLGASLVIHDPALTLPTPSQLWLTTGIKALDHAIEIAYSALGNDLVQGVAANSVRLIRELLPVSVSSEVNLEARARLQATAWSVIGLTQATSASVGLDHALVHRLGGKLGIAHGLATCMTLPHVMEFNLPAAVSSLALIGRVGFGSTESDPMLAATAAVEGTRTLIADLGLDFRLRDHVSDESILDEIAVLTLSDTGMAGNPRQDVTADDVLGILKRAW